MAESLDRIKDALKGRYRIERSVGLGMMNYPFPNEHDPHLAPLRGDPRFQRLMERVKKDWEEFEV
jgi:hypothetical protein